jgi:HD-GYP domain-containing protein (c-di-GMP phosphodiesterase class II)
MSDARALLTRISALRQRLEHAQGLLSQASSAAADPDTPDRLEREVADGMRAQALLDSSLRQIAGALTEEIIRPTQLTGRARRALEKGYELVGRLRQLGDDPIINGADADDPLPLGVRAAAAMTETAVRLVQAFPDAPSAQLRLSEGLDGILAAIADRVGTLAAAVAQRRQERERVETLAYLLAGLHGGPGLALDPFTALGESVLADARQGAPLRFLDAGPPPVTGDPTAARAWQVRQVASHSLTVAQVIARLARHAPEWRGQPAAPVLAALLHDAGLLGIPVTILAQPGPLTDGQRRAIEGHARAGAELVARQLPAAADLGDVIASHHERLDGTGYPAGLRAHQVPALSRLLAVADVYGAMACARPHRPAFDPRTALTDTLLLADRGLLDRTAAEGLLHLAFYPVGSVVELTDGSVGKVVATHAPIGDPHLPARPVLALLADGQGRLLPAPQHVDLAQSEGRSVVRTLPAAQRRQLLGWRYPEAA